MDYNRNQKSNQNSTSLPLVTHLKEVHSSLRILKKRQKQKSQQSSEQSSQHPLSLPPIFPKYESEKKGFKVYTEKEKWPVNDLKEYTVSQKKQISQGKRYLEQRQKEIEELEKQVKLEYGNKTTAQLDQLLQQLRKRQGFIRNEMSRIYTHYKHLTSERAQLQIYLAYEMKRNFAISNINKIKSSIEENESQISRYYDERNKFQRELGEIQLKRGFVGRLKIEREIGGKK